MEENPNVQQQAQNNNQPPENTEQKKDGLMPGQREEDELNLIGDTIFGIAAIWIKKLKNIFRS